MEEQRNPMKRYTVGALLLHTTVLFVYAAFAYFESFSYSPYYLTGIGILFSMFAGGFGIVGVWLTGEHYSETLRPSKLKMWGGIHVAFLFFPVVILFISFMMNPTILSLTILLPYLVLIGPPLLIIVLADKESP
jgi:hypothetical protein